MAYFLALDAGGTSTRCCVADEYRVLATVSCGTVKLMTVGNQVATSRLVALLEEAASQAGIALGAVSRTCMGLAGLSAAAVRGWAQVTLERHVGREVMLCGDEEIALEAAFRGGPGILVIAGTGSNVVGRCADGTTVGVGGWGPVVGDEGSGSWIGQQAMRAAFHALDRGVSTDLFEAAQRTWRLADRAQLVAYINHRERPDFSELALSVADCAENGDSVASSVLERAGEELARQVTQVMKKMHMTGCSPLGSTRVAFTGSVLAKVAQVQRSFQNTLNVFAPECTVDERPVEPLDGALWKARKGDEGSRR